MDPITTTGATPTDLRYVFIPRPRCPQCGATELKSLRSTTTEGVTSRRTQCLNRSCGHKFFVIID